MLFLLFLFVVSLSYFILAYSKHLLHYFCHQIESKLKQTGLWREMQWKMFFYLNCTLYWCPYFEAGDPDSFQFSFKMTSALEIHRKKHYVAAKMVTETIGLCLFSPSVVDKQLQTLTCYTSVYNVLNYLSARTDSKLFLLKISKVVTVHQ